MSIRYDDRDPRVHYAGTWGTGGCKAKSNPIIFRTINVEIGYRISVHGAISSSTGDFGGIPRATFVIDGNRTPWVGAQNAIEQRGIELFSSGILDRGNHVLTIINDSSEGTLWLDFFEIHGSNATVPSSQSSLLPQPSSDSSSMLPSETDVGALPTGSSAISRDIDRGGPPIGAIVGGVLGGVAALSLTIYKFKPQLFTGNQARHTTVMIWVLEETTQDLLEEHLPRLLQ
ncbi:hypothetical protein BKA70DRAFT_1218257 [Coprinopsis sp. MPI-PUGE-AT-0042]|nr:hypothetical protein BKA70DRAFT_1218257 [Coprinopsis sp. MPI-PUGE-AT-0042]